MTIYWDITRCRICGNTDLESILNLGSQALTGVFPKAGEDVPKGPLELVKCRDDRNQEACGLVQLRHSFKAGLLYGDNYGYRSGLNASMVAHLHWIAKSAKDRVQVCPGDLILDIGSNDGTLLRAMDEPGIQLIGMDPTGIKFRDFYPAHVHLITECFSASRFKADFGLRKPKIITSIAMFYDLESPLTFMRDVHDILDDEGIWVFEQSYLPMMFEATAYDTICHEHTEYYAFRQIQWMCSKVGFEIIDVGFNDTNGGSFIVTAAKIDSTILRNEAGIEAARQREAEMDLVDLTTYARFRNAVSEHKATFRAMLSRLADAGTTVFGYGASTKGNVLLQFCNITPKQVPYIAEVNQDKFGCVTPGTNIPIISEAEAKQMNPGCFLVLPWHFRTHIIRREAGFLSQGGSLLFPLPQVEVVNSSTVTVSRSN